MQTIVLGTGLMGQRHIQAALDAGLEIAGIADSNPVNLRQAAADFGIPDDRCSLDAGALVRESAAECVIVSTTAPAHCELTCLAAESGASYILCEKPMAVSLEQCDRMIEACNRAGALLAINHPHRFVKLFQKVRELVSSEEFGGLSSMTISSGNLGLAMNGSHLFEMFRFIGGEPLVSAAAWLSDEVVNNPRGAEFTDVGGAFRLTTLTGKRLYVDMGTDQGHGSYAICSGPYGQLLVDEIAGQIQLKVRQKADRGLPSTRYGSASERQEWSFPNEGAIGPARSTLEALISGRDYPDAQVGRHAIAALVACHVSNETGHATVELAGDLPAERVFPWA